MWVDVKEWGGLSIWVDEETGKVLRGTKGRGFDYRTVYPYKRANGGWDNCSGEYTLEQMLKSKVPIMWT